jgi:RNA polymerase sigma-70 factor (TIGR02960 family)
VTTDALASARAGDTEAFRRLVQPYERELHVHCYRILGSVQDAEDALQETLMAAWQGLGTFEERASIRTWLYRIATNRALNFRRASSRRPQMDAVHPELDLPEPSRFGEVLWLEPYPDLLLDELPDRSPGPEVHYETKEAISLAFVTALQLLPPRQRAALILRDVLGFHAREVAHILETTDESVTSALKRGRATLERRLEADADREPPPAPNSPLEREVVKQLTQAWEASDVDAIVGLLAGDVRFAMPPLPFEYHGRELAARFLMVVWRELRRRYRTVQTRANGQPAFGLYARDQDEDVFHALGLMVVTLAGDRVAEIVRFDSGVLARFGLPRSLSDG